MMNNSSLQSYIQKTQQLKTLISFSETEFVSIGYFSKNFSRRDITKEHYTLMYVIDGKGTYIDKSKKSHELKAGTLVLRHPGDIHSVLRDSQNPWLEFYIIIPGYFYEFLKKSRSIPDFDVSHIPINSQWLKTLINLTEKCIQFSINNKERAFPELQQFFLTLKEKQLYKRKYQSGQDEILEICRIIDSSPESRMSNSDLAEKAGFGLEHFRKLFRDIVGCAPQEYIINSRIKHAQRMLIDDKFKLDSIAFSLGYPDLPSFSRQFKKVTSMSPTDYKRMINEN